MGPLKPAQGRLDVAIYNESTAFLITSEGVHKELGANSRGDIAQREREVTQGLYLPIQLVQDSGLNVRVVLGRLTAQEEADWIGRIEADLGLPSGVLVLAGGTGYIHGDDRQDFLQRVAAPPGSYRVTIDSHIPGVNGEHDLPARPDGVKESVSAWFKRTRPGAELPLWLRWWMENDADEEDLEEGEEIEDEDDLPPMIDFVVRLLPRTPDMRPPRLVMQDGWLRPGDTRRPPKCPLGLEATKLRRRIQLVEADDDDED